MLITLLTTLIVFNVTTYFTDDFTLSNNKYIKFSQILSPLLLMLFFVVFYYILTGQYDDSFNIWYLNDKSDIKNINISINTEYIKFKELLIDLAFNLGLSVFISAPALAVAKHASKSSNLSTLQKAIAVLTAAILGC